MKARISDLQGVGSVQLLYQVCAPGAFIPSTLPLTTSQILANPRQALPANPAFENPANWQTITMVDDGSAAGDTPGDGVFTDQMGAFVTDLVGAQMVRIQQGQVRTATGLDDAAAYEALADLVLHGVASG